MNITAELKKVELLSDEVVEKMKAIDGSVLICCIAPSDQAFIVRHGQDGTILSGVIVLLKEIGIDPRITLSELYELAELHGVFVENDSDKTITE